MPNPDEIRQSADLPFGYRVTFVWSKQNGAVTEWSLDVPAFGSQRAWRKFRDAYNIARRSFYEAVAVTIGGTVLIVDTDGPTEAVLPASKH